MDRPGPAKYPLWCCSDSKFGDGDHLVRALLMRKYAIGMHTHDFCEINIVTLGKGLHYIGEMVVEVQAGDVFVMPPDVLHGYRRLGELNVLHILASPAFFTRYREELEAMPGYAKMFAIEPYLRQVYDKSLFLQLTPTEMTELSLEFERIRSFDRTGAHVPATVTALHIILLLCQKFHDRRFSKGNSPASGEIFTMMEYIRAHLDERLSLCELADVAKMSRSTFCRQFEKIVQMSPGEYVRKTRIEQAQRMLAEGKCSRTEIALSCGFYDVSHMNRCLLKQ